MTHSNTTAPLDYAQRPRGPGVRRPWLWVLACLCAFGGFVWFFVPFKTSNQSEQARVAAARNEVLLLQTALDAFKVDNSRYPTSEEGLTALVDRPAGLNDWHGPYIKSRKILTDPWGNPYVYHVLPAHSTGTIAVGTVGRDGKEGTADDFIRTSP